MTALFDFDGVVMDTEPQYTVFWDRIGEECLGRKGFAAENKGQTLKHILSKYFSGREALQREISSELDRFEHDMPYMLVPGVLDFFKELKDNGICTAIVTSSNNVKMGNVYRVCPELREMAGHIYTSEDFSRSKPDPECFLLAMRDLGCSPADTVIFEDSVSGLQAARSAGAAVVIGLVTTNPAEVIRPYADILIPDFMEMTVSRLSAILHGPAQLPACGR